MPSKNHQVNGETQNMKKYTGVEVLYTSADVIDQIFKEKEIEVSDLKTEKVLYPNECLVIKAAEGSGKQSALGRVLPNGKTVRLIPNPLKVNGITARNKEQAMLMAQLVDVNIPLNIVTGLAGSGKTLCALAVALDLLLEQQRYKKLILTRPMDVVGNIDLGAMPGDVRDKFAPYTINFTTNLEQLIGSNGFEYLRTLEDNRVIQYLPIQLMRGASFKDSIVIADEVQVLNSHEMKTICTRIGENSKLIIMGDLTQRDRDIKIPDTGIYKLINHPKVKESPMCSAIELIKCERSPLAQLMTEVL